MATQDNPDRLLPEALHEHVEAFSLAIERFGFPRMAGRIFALMLLRDEPLVTQAELATELGASTGSISTMIRLLEQLGFVERVSLPAQRRDRFRLSDDPFIEMSWRRIESARRFGAILQAARDTRILGPEAEARLAGAQAFYEFFTDEMDSALRRWKAQA